MAAEKHKIKFKVDGENFGKFKLREGERRMKLYIKLSKEETGQWNTLKEALTGGKMSNDVLARILFFKGIHTITQELNDRIENMTEDEKKEIMEQITAGDLENMDALAEEEFGVKNEDSEESND